MQELNNRSEFFCKNWEKRRKIKWFYVFLHGSVYWGIPIGLILMFSISDFKLENISLSKLITYVVVFGIGGTLHGLREFKRNEKKYSYLLNVKDNFNEEILKGIQILKAGKQWSFENLKIHNETDESLTVQNELFWFDERVPASEKLDECYQSVYSDLQRLQKNNDFCEYAKNRKVKIQILDNSQSIVPLFEKDL